MVQQKMDELEEKMKLQQQVAVLESNAKQFLDKEALMRYGNIKAVDPEKAIKIAMLISQAVQNGQLKEKLSDSQFKDLLMSLQEPNKEFNVVRK